MLHCIKVQGRIQGIEKGGRGPKRKFVVRYTLTGYIGEPNKGKF